MGNVDSKDIPQYGNDQKDFARDASSSKKLKLDPIHFSVETSKVSSIEEQDKDKSSPDKTEDIPDPVSAAAKELSEVITQVYICKCSSDDESPVAGAGCDLAAAGVLAVRAAAARGAGAGVSPAPPHLHCLPRPQHSPLRDRQAPVSACIVQLGKPSYCLLL